MTAFPRSTHGTYVMPATMQPGYSPPSASLNPDAVVTRIPSLPGNCCDLHNRHCEPPSELCCPSCTEAGHPEHPRGVRCVLDLSGENR